MDIVQEPNVKQCSNCKVYIPEVNFDLHEVHCKTRLKLCDLCHCPFPKTELKQHYLDEHAPEPCDLCGEKLPRDKLDVHKETTCPRVRVECKFCELEILRSEYEEHQNDCGSRTDFCMLCNQRVMLKDMDEHKQIKCGRMRSEYTMNSDALMRTRLEGGEGDVDDVNWSSEEFMLARSCDQWNRPSNFSPLRAHRPSIPSISPPLSYDTLADNTVHVDPQWLASVSGVCGQDSMGQVLAQNLQAVEKYGSSNSVNLYSSDRASKRDVESFRPDVRCSKDTVQRQNMHEGYHEGLAAPSVSYDSDRNLTYHRRVDFIPRPLQGSMSREELERIETEKKDAELAWIIHERDNACSWHGDQSSKTTAGGSNAGEESDAEMALMIHEQDVLYAQRNQSKDGSTDRRAHDNTGLRSPVLSCALDGSRNTSTEESELMDRVLRSSTTQSQTNRNLETGNSVGCISTEDDDAEMARRIHERDLAYATCMKNARHDGREGFNWVSTGDTELLEERYNRGASHHDKKEVSALERLESLDVMLARTIAQRESDYVKELEMDRMLAKQMQEALNSTQNVFEVARIQMEQNFEGSLRGAHTYDSYNSDVLRNEQPRAKTPAAELEYSRDEGEVPCQYCYSLFPFKMIMEHQQLCMSEQSEDLYSSSHPSGGELVLKEEAVQGVSNTPVNRTLRDLERETEKCEYCNAMMTIDALRVHQVTCESNPDSHLRNAYLHRTPQQSDESLLTMSSQHHPTSTVGVNHAKGPCEICGELIPIDTLVRHEGTCEARGMTSTSSSAPVSTVMSAQHEEVGGANSMTQSTGDTLAVAGSTTAASNPGTKQDIPFHTSRHSSKPSPDVLRSSLNPLSTTPSWRTNHHHLHQSQSASIALTTNKKTSQFPSSSLQSKQAKTDKRKTNSMRKVQEKSHEQDILHGRQRFTTTRSQATESLGIIGRPIGTKSVRTTAGACDSKRTEKNSQAAVYQTNRPSSVQTLPEVASSRKTLHHQNSDFNLTPPEEPLTKKTLRQTEVTGKGRADRVGTRDSRLPDVLHREKHEQ